MTDTKPYTAPIIAVNKKGSLGHGVCVTRSGRMADQFFNV